MEIAIRSNKTKISPAKLKEVKVHWTISKPISQKACENFNRILASAQLRVYRKFLETT